MLTYNLLFITPLYAVSGFITQMLIGLHNANLLLHQPEATKKIPLSTFLLTGVNTAKNTVIHLVLLSVILTLLVGIFYYRHKYKKLNKQFISERVLNESLQEALVSKRTKPVHKSITISEKVVAPILKRLEHFENKRGFLRKKLTLTVLADKMKTNPNYLAKVIKQQKGKEYNEYINKLRINYLITMFEINNYQNYTILALANELGFGSTKSFNQAFYKSEGIKFADFMERVKKQLQDKK